MHDVFACGFMFNTIGGLEIETGNEATEAFFLRPKDARIDVEGFGEMIGIGFYVVLGGGEDAEIVGLVFENGDIELVELLDAIGVVIGPTSFRENFLIISGSSKQ